MKKVYTFIIFSLLISNLNAQDASFSQFYANPLYVNPAYTGLNTGLRVGLDYRSQWGSISNPFTTYNIYGDIQDFNLGGGIGVMAMNDVEGSGFIKTTTFGGFYSYRLVVTPRLFDIQAGFGVSYVMKSVDWSRLVFSDQLDPVLGNVYQSAAIPPPNQNRNFIDIDAGGLTRFQTTIGNTDFSNTFGVAVHHLTEPNESLSGLDTRLPMKITVHYGTLIPLQGSINWNNIFISPNIIWEKQSNFTTLNFGFYVMKAPVYVGAFYRQEKPILQGGDAFIAAIGMKIESNEVLYQFGYSYDLTTSSLATNTGGTHEITLIIQFQNARLTNSNSVHGLRKSNNCFKFGNGFLGL